MRTLLGRGFSDPAASLFVEDGKGFLGDARADRPLPDWLSEADLATFQRGLPEIRLSRRAELVPQHRSQLGIDRAVARRADPSAVAVHCGIERFGHHRPDRRQACRRDGAGAAEPASKSSSSTAPATGSSRNAPTRSTRPDRFSQGTDSGRDKAGSIEPASGQQLARSARIDRRIGGNRPGARRA